MPTIPFSTDDPVIGDLIKHRESIEANRTSIQSVQEEMQGLRCQSQTLERRQYILELAYVLLCIILIGFGIYYMYTRKFEFFRIKQILQGYFVYITRITDKRE